MALSTANFITDPVYRKLVMGASLQMPSISTGETPVEAVGSEDGGVVNNGLPQDYSLSTQVSGLSPTYEPEATFGVVNQYGTSNRIAEAVSKNFGAIASAAQYQTLEPLKMAAIGEAVDTAFGYAPDYITKETSQGVMSQIGGFESTKTYGQFPDGRIAEVTAEDLTDPNIKELTAAEANRLNPVGYIGADPRTPLGALGAGVQAVATAAVPFLSTMFGKVGTTPAGQPMALGSGFMGPAIQDEMFRADSLVKAGTPGVFTMTFGKNGFASYRATENTIFGFDIEGARTTRLSADQFKRLYGANAGYDYRKVDWANSVANSGELQGPKLTGFTSQGGLTQEGEFIDRRGTIYDDLNSRQLETYISSLPNDPVVMAQVAGVFSAKAAGASGYRAQKYLSTATRLAELAGGAAQREYQQGLGLRTPEEIAYEDWAGVDDDGGPATGTTTVGGTDYTTVSGSNGEGRGINRSVSGDTRTDSRGNTTNFNVDPTDETYFAEGGRVGKEEGGEIGPVGFVNGRTPEEVTEADTVEDDVEGSVPEGTFVINAVAVERYGSERIRKLLTSALQEAERQGIDISATDSTITDEDSVSVAVSEGEVLVPPVLVRIIGLEKLEKINALGQEEVDERVEEYGQAETSEPIEGEAPVQASVGGGFIERQKKAPGGKVNPRRIIPHSDFKSFLSSDMKRNITNFLEIAGGYATGTVDDMEKAYSYSENWGINNNADDRYRDTMRHGLVGGLYAGGPDDNIFKKIGSKAASYYADEKDRLNAINPDYEPEIREESAIDYNNNRYGRALRKAVGEEEAFVQAMEHIMDRMRRGEAAPYVTDEDGNKITLQLSTGK